MKIDKLRRCLHAVDNLVDLLEDLRDKDDSRQVVFIKSDANSIYARLEAMLTREEILKLEALQALWRKGAK